MVWVGHGSKIENDKGMFILKHLPIRRDGNKPLALLSKYERSFREFTIERFAKRALAANCTLSLDWNVC